MCRNIKKLRNPEGPPTDRELEDAALQFVRKVSGYRVPSRANEAAFNRAVSSIAAATRDLFDSLVTNTTSSRTAEHRTADRTRTPGRVGVR